MERLCLCSYFTCTKLRHYLLNAETHVVCKAIIIKHMLLAPILKGRLGKWVYAISEFDVRFQPAKAVKGQALADLITERASPSAPFADVKPWVMFFDGSTCEPACGIGILIISPRGVIFQVFGDSKVVIRQLTEDYDCASDYLHSYFLKCHGLMSRFRQVTLTWLPREWNGDANKLAQVASGYVPQTDDVSVEISQLSTADWRVDLLQYLKDLTRGADRKTRRRALKHVLVGDEMYFRAIDEVLLKCLVPSEILDVVHDVHKGTRGTHQSAHKMKWLIRWSGFYWPAMLEDCFKY
jgi:hypothetical protein